jgi:excisionase family DNA binding protein
MLTTKEAAARFNLSVSKLAKLRMSGDGPVFCKMGRSVRYAESDLANWLRACRRRSTTEDE